MQGTAWAQLAYSRLLLCLLHMSTAGLGPSVYRASGTEQRCSSSLPHRAACALALLGPRALGTARPTLALQDVPGAPAAVPTLCPIAAYGGMCREGLGLRLEKGLIPSQRRRAAQHGCPLVPPLWRHKQNPRNQLSRLSAGSSQNLLFIPQIWQI